jgi:hypothetical protein
MGYSVSFGSSVGGFDDSNFTEALSAKMLDRKKLEGILSDTRHQASSTMSYLVSVGKEQMEMIELSRKNCARKALN